jgi:O-antigen/teichoic acid export membrane protein
LPDLSIYILLGSLTTAAIVLDDGCVGLLRGNLQLKRNFTFSLIKLLALPVFAVTFVGRTSTAIILAWLLGVAVSFVTLLPSLRSATANEPLRFDFNYLVSRRRLLVSHHWLNVSIQAQRFLVPVIVAGLLGATANAAYYTAYLLVGFITVIPTHLCTALFALAPGDEAGLHREVKLTIKLCAALAVVSYPFLFVLGPVFLGFYGHTYLQATGAIRILGLLTFPAAVKSHFVAISRVRGAMSRAAVLSTLGLGLEVSFAVLGGLTGGLAGVSLGLLIAYLVETVLFSPTVWSVLKPGTPRALHLSAS